MYHKHFGIDENPFSIAPDPRYLYMSDGHREAFAHLLYGVKGDGGFVLLTGEVGTGKTTVCRCLLEQIPPDSNIAIILNPKITVPELLASICDELGIVYPPGNTSVKIFVDHINSYLLAAHALNRKTVLIIDEAQNLETDVLEQIRLLTNLETNRQKLLQIIMLGQPELLAKLARPELRQLAQRITARYHLGPLQKKEIGPYVVHRLAVAGLNSPLFSGACLNRLYKLSGGIPRLINTLCDRAMLGAYAQGQKNIDESILTTAAREVFGNGGAGKKNKKNTSRLAFVLAGILVAGGVALAATYFRYETPQITSRPAQQEPRPAAQGDQLVPPSELAGFDDLQPQEPAPVDSAQAAQRQTALASPDTPPATPDADLMVWPADQPLELSLQSSYTSLFAQWGIDHTPQTEEEICKFAKAGGLRCLHLRGEFNSLLSLDRPAVLRLYDPRSNKYYATLVGADEQTATLVFNNVTKHVAISDLASRWFGYYTILWRPPPGYGSVIHPNSRGQAITWLDQQMATINGRPAQTRENSTYNAKLVEEVKEFQRLKNLAPDGILGPQTLIRINTAAGLKVPTLRDGPKMD